MMWHRLVLALALVFFSICVRADQFRPAYLLLHQSGPETYDVLWKVPALSETTALSIRPEFPAGSEDIAPHRNSYVAGASVQRWQVRVPQGIEGKRIKFTGLSRSGIDVLARFERSDGTEQVERILPMHPGFTLRASPGAFEVMLTYTQIGIEHILTGADHLLFVLALMMIVQGRKMLLLTITSFTVAHSITLALATLKLIHVPGPPVEAIIALSIVFVSKEICARERGQNDIAIRSPWIVAFVFGLLHGLGFAGALAEIGLHAASIPLGLLFFNIGVEIGQLLFVAAVLVAARAALLVIGRHIDRRITVTLPAYLIGGTASYWLFMRVSGF
jgi:hydrogenase/urease accessory protein HupE